MAKYFVVFVLWSLAVFGQNSMAPLNNETIIRLVAAGVPTETIINTIRSASAVNFGFLTGDLTLLQRYHVPDDVVKAMAAKDRGKPIPNFSAPVVPAKIAPPQVQPQPTRQPAIAESISVAEPQTVLTNDSILKLVKAGMGEEVILSMIGSQSGQYSLSTDNLIALKQAGASDKVIAAMVNQNAKHIPAGISGSVDAPRPLPTPIVNPATEQTSNSTQSARIFITDSNSWEISGSFAAASNRNGGGASGHVAGGARPQTVEVIKTFGERCPGLTVTMDRAQAQFIVLFDHEGGKGYVRKDNKIAVFRASGDLLFSHSTRSLGNAVKDVCEAIFP